MVHLPHPPPPEGVPSAIRPSWGSVVVTGAAGFIGAALVRAIVRGGLARRVVGIDNFDPFYAPSIKRRRWAWATADADLHRVACDLITRDITDAPTPGEEPAPAPLVPEGCDVVFHLAAKAGVNPSLADPAGYMRANVVGTAAILHAAAKAHARAAVVASSSSVYGNQREAPFHEGMHVDQPISPYAASKRATELTAWTHHHATGMPTACLRFFTVYGPGQRPDLAIARFLAEARKVRAGLPAGINVFGDGSTSRDYTFVDDVVAGVLASAHAILRRPAGDRFRIWNLGNSSPVRLSELIATVEAVTGVTLPKTTQPPQPGDVERTWASLDRSRAELGYAPTTTLRDGIAAQWASMLAEEASADVVTLEPKPATLTRA